jgi:hypothetical protein
MRRSSDCWSVGCPERYGRLTLEKEEKLSGTKLAYVIIDVLK